jgi:peptide/nickel transport system permease protein
MDETPLLENATLEQNPPDTPLIPPIPENEKPQRNWRSAGVYFPRRLALALLTLAAAWLLLLYLRDQLPLDPMLASAGEELDWSVSWTVGKPVSELVGERQGNTLWLLGVALSVGLISSMFYALVALLIHRVGQRIPPLGSVLRGLGRLTVFHAAAPVFVVGMFSIILFSLTFHDHNWPELPVSGLLSLGSPPQGSLLERLGGEPGSNLDRLVHLIQPALALSLFTSLLTAQVVTRELTRQRERGDWPLNLLRLPLGTLGTLLGQIGGLLSASMLVELLFAYPGIGRLAFDAAMMRDYPVLMRVALVYLVIGFVARLLADLLQTLDRFLSAWQGDEQQEKALDWNRAARLVWLAVGMLALLVPLALGLWGLGGDKDAALRLDPSVRLLEPGGEHPWGTDELGRDVQARVRAGIPLMLQVSVAVATLALFIGGVWGIVAGLLAGASGWLGESLSDLLLWPADVLLAVPPLLLAMILILVVTPDQGETIPSGMVYALLLLLTPRAARATRNLVQGRSPERHIAITLLVGPLAVGLGLLYAAILFSASLDFVGLGVRPPEATLGLMLGSGMRFVFQARYMVLIPGVVLIMLLYPLYLAANVLLDVLDLRTRDVLTEFNK